MLVPRRLDRWAVDRLVRTSLGVSQAWTRRIEDRMRQVLGPYLRDADFHSMAVDYCEMAREVQWLRMRAYHTTELPVETSAEGIQRIEDARGYGNGVILWGMSFCDPLPVKIALQRAGVPVVHLSHAEHGVPRPPTEFGLKIVGPFFCASENPFLLERVIIPADESVGYLRLLMDRLTRNGCVYIRGDIRSRRTNVIAPVFGRDMKLAPGAPGLSWKLGSPLLPIHVVRDGPFRYRAVIHPPIEVGRDLDKKQFIRKAVDQFAELIERSALASPSSWELSDTMWADEWDS